MSPDRAMLERRRDITRKQVERFERAIAEAVRDGEPDHWAARAELEGMREQLKDLRAELREIEEGLA